MDKVGLTGTSSPAAMMEPPAPDIGIKSTIAWPGKAYSYIFHRSSAGRAGNRVKQPQVSILLASTANKVIVLFKLQLIYSSLSVSAPDAIMFTQGAHATAFKRSF